MKTASCSNNEVPAQPSFWTGSDVLTDLERNGEWIFVKELIDTFLKDAATRIETMRSAASATDTAALAASSHTLKGSALLMNAVPLVELSAEIERCAKRNEPRDYVGLVDRANLALADLGQALISYAQGLPRT